MMEVGKWTNGWSLTGRFLSAAALLCAGVMGLVFAWVSLANLDEETASMWVSASYLAAGIAISVGVIALCRIIPAGSQVRFCICLAAAALALRGAFVLLAPTEPRSDFGHMYWVARALAGGENTMNSNPYFQWWPYQSGFVVWMAFWIRLFGVGVGFFQGMNCLCAAASTLLVYALARRFASVQSARAAAVLYLIYPGTTLLAPVLTNQHLSELLLLGALYVGTGGRVDVRSRTVRGLFGGVLLGLSNAIRPAAVVVALAVLVTLLLELFRWREPGSGGLPTVAAGALAFVGAYCLTGQGLSWMIQATGLNDGGLRNNVPWWKFILGLNETTAGRYSREDEQIVFAAQDLAEIQAAAQKLLGERLSGLTPGSLLKLFWKKIEIMWGGFEQTGLAFTQQVIDRYGEMGRSQELEWALEQGRWISSGLYMGDCLLAAAGCVRAAFSRDKGRPLALLLALAGLAYFCAHLLVEIQVRYRTLMLVFLFPLTALGADWLAALGRHLADRRKGTRP